MLPANEKVAPNNHDYSREKGYVEKPYEHQEYPKVVNGVTVNSAEEEAALAPKPAEDIKLPVPAGDNNLEVKALRGDDVVD